MISYFYHFVCADELGCVSSRQIYDKQQFLLQKVHIGSLFFVGATTQSLNSGWAVHSMRNFCV